MPDPLLPGEFLDAVIELLTLFQSQDEDTPQPPFAESHTRLLI
jgi:hypothetical protein